MTSDGKGARAIFHFAGSDYQEIVSRGKLVYDVLDKRDVPKWQVFWDRKGVKHIVNMDNVTFIEVVDDE